jgi:hypothetical protein
MYVFATGGGKISAAVTQRRFIAHSLASATASNSLTQLQPVTIPTPPEPPAFDSETRAKGDDNKDSPPPEEKLSGRAPTDKSPVLEGPLARLIPVIADPVGGRFGTGQGA